MQAHGETPLIGPIVVGYDDHPTSQRALAQAVELARRLEQHLRVVHVVDIEDRGIDPASDAWDRDLARRAQLLASHARDFVDLPPDQWSYVSTSGDVWHRLVREGDDLGAWLIVVGSHTHAHGVAAAVGRLFSGTGEASVTDGLVHSGRLSVLVVSATDEASVTG